MGNPRGIRLNTSESGTTPLLVSGPEYWQLYVRSLTSREMLAAALGVTYGKHLVYYLYRMDPALRYEQFQIPKSGGGVRTISAPATGLKLVQRRLALLLRNTYSVRTGAHGFLPERSPYTNATQHIRRKHILNVDLANFFSSINFGRVRGAFLAPPYSLSADIATLLAQICCHDNVLPQGAPTSPIVSNIICGRLDAALKRLSRENRAIYTRYADDITFSSNERDFPPALAEWSANEGERLLTIGAPLIEAVKSNGFQINDTKSRLLSRSDRQVVTGLVVNRKVNVSRKYVRSIRGAIHAIRRHGPELAQIEFATNKGGENRDLRRVIRGRIQHVGTVRGKNDPIYRKLRDEFNEVSDLKIPTAAGIKEQKLDRAVWIIESDEIFQGTAFFLKNVGLVTCAHCVGEGGYIYHPAKPSEKFAVDVSAIDSHRDLAILTPQGTPQYLELESTPFSDVPLRGSEIVLSGYPSFGPGKSLSVKRGEITSIGIKHGVPRINISESVISGNSGGPLLNRHYRVIGVAVTGAENSEASEKTDDHSAIPISQLELLINQAKTNNNSSAVGMPTASPAPS